MRFWESEYGCNLCKECPINYLKLKGESMSSIEIAEVCHEVNRAYCQSQGDGSQVSWDKAPAWQRESIVKGVELHLGGEVGPEASHEAWVAEKMATGWKWGAFKNEHLQEHPNIMPFDALPVSEQAKDFIFKGVVDALRKYVVHVNVRTMDGEA